jgi:hypothetical protein
VGRFETLDIFPPQNLVAKTEVLRPRFAVIWCQVCADIVEKLRQVVFRATFTTNVRNGIPLTDPIVEPICRKRSSVSLQRKVISGNVSSPPIAGVFQQYRREAALAARLQGAGSRWPASGAVSSKLEIAFMGVV